jgi:hypothetical protein
LVDRAQTAVHQADELIGKAARIQRLSEPPRAVPLLQGAETLYEVKLNANPSPAWRAFFLRPPGRLTAHGYTPTRGRVGLGGGTVHFRTTPDMLDAWLRRIDLWIACANSVVEE